MHQLTRTTAALALATAVVAIPGHLPTPGASAMAPCTSECYVDAAVGSILNGGTGPTDALHTIQAGLDQVDSGGTVFVAAGTYPETLDVNKPLTLEGAGSSAVTVDASASGDDGVEVGSADVALRGFTLTGNPAGASAFGVKIAGPPPTRISNIIVENVVINNSGRTGLDLNGIDGAIIRNVEVNGVTSGNGLAATDSSDVVFENITTSNNAWGGLAMYTLGEDFSLGSDNIKVRGTNSFAEPTKVYVRTGNFNTPTAPEPVTNLTVEGFAFTVRNDTFTPGGDAFTFYQLNQTEAIAFAAGLATPADSFVNEIATGDFVVGTVGGIDMTIQAAIDHAAAGDTVRVLAGMYDANVTVDESVQIVGAGSGPDEIDNTILAKGTNSAVLTITASGTSAANPILLQDLRVEPVGEYGFNIPGPSVVQFVEFNNVHVIGTNTGADFEAEVGLKVATTASLSDVVVVDSAFDNLVYGWYLAKHGDWGPGGSNVTNVQVSGTSFSNNQAKGLYVEKLSDATFDDVTVVNNGLDTTFFNAKWNSGLDINLKGEEAYQNIAITNSTIDGNGLGVDEGTGLAIKARDDGATYGAHPATLSGVTISGNNITGNERGLRFGEPGKDNATPIDATTTANNITGNLVAGVVNETLSSTPAPENWWGDPAGPSGEGLGSGDSVSANVTFCPWLDGATDIGNLVLDTCPGSNSLEVTHSVVWNGALPDAGQAFQICIQGPTHPVADCQLADFDGGTLTWDALYRGDYVVSETPPGSDWTVDIVGSPVTVADSQEATPAEVTNTSAFTIEEAPVDAPPMFDTPLEDISVATDPGASSASVGYDAPVATDDDVTTPPTVTCQPASGSEFAIGDTVVTCTATDSGGQTVQSSFTVTVNPFSDLIAVDPARFLDTRGNGANITIDGDSQGNGPLEAGGTTRIFVAGRGAIPDDAIGAMVNIAAISPSGKGFATLYPCSEDVPVTASLNFETEISISNATFVDLSDDGAVCVYSSNSTGLALDVVGYLPSTSRLGIVDPARILETRLGSTFNTIDGRSQGDGTIPAGNTVEVKVAGRAGVPDDAVAAMVNVAAVNPTDAGYITLYPCDNDRPIAASLNYTIDTNISNATLVELSSDGELCVFTEDATDLTIDVVGFAPPGTDVGTINPGRFLDTRIGNDKVTIDGRSQNEGRVAGGAFIEVPIAGRGDVPGAAISAVVNVAAIKPADTGFVTLYPCTDTPPRAASLNYTPEVDISNAILVDLSVDGSVCAFVSTATHLAIDVLSYVLVGHDETPRRA